MLHLPTHWPWQTGALWDNVIGYHSRRPTQRRLTPPPTPVHPRPPGPTEEPPNEEKLAGEQMSHAHTTP